MHGHDRHNTTALSIIYITRQLHISANTIFGHHQVGYNYRRKLHNI